MSAPLTASVCYMPLFSLIVSPKTYAMKKNKSGFWLLLLLLSIVDYVGLTTMIISMVVYEKTNSIFTACLSAVVLFIVGVWLVFLLLKTLYLLVSEQKQDSHSTIV